ncbi:MAG: hypothetical protein E6K76_12270 [Candidatus Eisenbacteria bacterium]|uniref:DUF3185 domain-containing protein n=1 Tax=Eiseniibacteriota bacterium TaxID=2212470 RepID=A0A538SZA9_UNCEI|nr:MAG: hypothetical protein E6K76_12270 [Candidatus Eisenbacteria bacterium]
MKLLGLALVILGAIALIYGLVGHESQTTMIDLGGIKATATEHKTFPFVAGVGVGALIGGVALLLASKRRA